LKLNKLFLSLILSVATVFIYAQEKLTFSIQGGVNYSSLRFEDDRITDHDSEVGYLFGMSSNFYLGKKLYLDIEVNYERKKVSVYVSKIFINSVSFGGDFRNFDIYEFITLPVMLRYEIGEINSFYVKGGPFLGCLLTAKEKINDGDLSQNLSEYFTDFDFGFSIGIGKIFSLDSSNKLMLELRNNIGLTNINNDPRSQYTKTNSLNFIVAWNFVL
jgi:hypothetical protein